MSGTPIVCLFHHIFHILSTVLSATGQAEVVRSIDDSQASQGSAEGMFCTWVLSSDRGNQMEAKWMDRSKTEMDEDEDANGHKRPCHIYWVMSSSKCEGPVQEHDISVQSCGDTIHCSCSYFRMWKPHNKGNGSDTDKPDHTDTECWKCRNKDTLEWIAIWKRRRKRLSLARAKTQWTLLLVVRNSHSLPHSLVPHSHMSATHLPELRPMSQLRHIFTHVTCTWPVYHLHGNHPQAY